MSIAINGHRYRHFKKETMIYTVIEANALDCDNLTPLVVYKSEYETPDRPKGTIWVREKAEFESKKVLPDGTEVERFTDITEISSSTQP